MTIEKIERLKEELNLKLEAVITTRKAEGDYKEIKPLQMPDHYNYDLRIRAVKARMNNIPQNQVAKEFGVSPTRVRQLFEKSKREFFRFLAENYLDLPSFDEFMSNELDEDMKQKFIWFLDHLLIIKGYQDDHGVYIPANLKPIDVPIDESPLREDVKQALKENGFTNINQITPLTRQQIKHLPKLRKSMLDHIMQYFYLYKPNAAPEHYKYMR